MRIRSGSNAHSLHSVDTPLDAIDVIAQYARDQAVVSARDQAPA